MGTTNPAHLAAGCAASGLVLDRKTWYELLVAAAGVSSHRILGMALPDDW